MKKPLIITVVLISMLGFLYLYTKIGTNQIHTNKENDTSVSKNIVEKIYLKDINNYTIEPVEKLNKLPHQKDERISYTVTNGKANIYVSAIHNSLTETHTLYTYDFISDNLKKIKECKENEWIIEFTELNGSYIYAYVENQESDAGLFSIKIVEEKDGEEKRITKVTIDNWLEYKPFFTVKDNVLYFMLSDIVSYNDSEQQTFKQKFVSYQNGVLTTLFECSTPYIDPFNWEVKKGVRTNAMFVQGSGSIMFQEFKEKTSILHYLKDGEMKQYELSSTDDILQGYLDHYAILYSLKEKKQISLDLITGKLTDVGLTNPAYEPQIYNDTVLHFLGRQYRENWIMALQEDGTFKIEELNIVETLNKDKHPDMQLRFSTDGKNILLETVVVNDVNDITKAFYTLTY